MKIFDNVFLRLFGYSIVISIICFFVKKIYYSIPIILALIALCELTIVLVKNKRYNLKVGKFKLFLKFKGHKYTIELLKNLFNTKYNVSETQNQLLLEKDGKRILLYTHIKFSTLSYEDIANALRIANDINADCIYFLYANIERKALTLKEYSTIPVKLLSFKKFTRYAERQGVVIPKNTQTISCNLKKLIKIISLNIGKNTGFKLLFCSLITIICSLLTPFKTYYRIISLIQIIVAIICFIVQNKKTYDDILQ